MRFRKSLGKSRSPKSRSQGRELEALTSGLRTSGLRDLLLHWRDPEAPEVHETPAVHADEKTERDAATRGGGAGPDTPAAGQADDPTEHHRLPVSEEPTEYQAPPPSEQPTVALPGAAPPGAREPPTVALPDAGLVPAGIQGRMAARRSPRRADASRGVVASSGNKTDEVQLKENLSPAPWTVSTRPSAPPS